MKKLLTIVLLFSAMRLLAVSPVPFTESLGFSFKIGGTGSASVTLYDETGSQYVLATASGSTIESATGTAMLRPGKTYSLEFWGLGPPSYLLSLVPPAGYSVYVNGVETNLVGQSPGTGWFLHYYTVEIRPVSSLGGSMWGSFSGIALGKSITWEVGLGDLRTGRGAGTILFKELDLANSPASREHLYYAAPPANVGQIVVIKDGASNQTLRQIVTPIGFTDLVDVTGGYEIRCYFWNQVSSWNGTLYGFTGSPWKTIKVESPAANQLKITETEGSVVRVSNLVGTGSTTETGGTITYNGSSTQHTFTSGGTLSLSSAHSGVSWLVVGGGGGGGSPGGGGGGDVEYLTGQTISPGNYSIVVGAGGAKGDRHFSSGGNGGSSSAFGTTAYGGGGGGGNIPTEPTVGGSGGGGHTNGYGAAAGSGTRAYKGGGGNYTGTVDGGGGGGAGGDTQNAFPGGGTYTGGNGYSCSISGSAQYYGGGGGGGRGANAGGLGGGGAGGDLTSDGTAGVANTGGGGGGGAADGFRSGGDGGSGIVIVSYPTPTMTWTLQEGDGTNCLRTTIHTSTPGVDQRDVVVTVNTTTGTYASPTNTVVSKTKYHYVTQAWGVEELMEVTADPDSANPEERTTSYTYHTSSSAYGNYRKVKSVTAPTGNWTVYEYYDDWDRRGQLKYEYHPYLDSPSAASSYSTTTGRVIYFEYTADWTGRYTRPTLREERINNTLVGKTTWSHGDNTGSGEPRAYATINSYRDGSNYQSDYSESYRADADPDFAGRAYQVKGANLTHAAGSVSRGTFNTTTKDFTVGSGGDHWRELKFNGSTSSVWAESVTSFNGQSCPAVYMIPNVSTLDVTIRIAQGYVYRTATYVYTGSGNFSLMTYEDFEYDAYGHCTQRWASNGALTHYTYTNGRLTSTTDLTGAETQFIHDEIGRVKCQVKTGASALTVDSITHAAQGAIYTYFEYDGANRVRKTIVSASSTKPSSPGTLDLVNTATYDLAGRLTQEVQFSGSARSLTTGYAYSSGGKIVTATLPGSSTKITEVHLDGQAKSVTGTGVVNEFAVYSVDSGTGQRVTVQRPVSTSYGATTTTTFDWLGRPVTVVRPAWGSGTTTQTNYYNSSGQLWKSAQTGVAPTLYVYDSLGALSREGLDTDQSDTLVPASTDRIKDYSHYYFNYSGGWYLEKTVYTYASDNSGTATLLNKQNWQLSNLPSNTFSSSYNYDVFGNAVVSVQQVNRSGKQVTNLTAYPDSSTLARQIVHNGLAVESRDQAGVKFRSEYDVIGRLKKSFDPRTGATETAYLSGTSLVDWIKDPAGKEQATYTYDSAGRVDTVANALGNVARCDYNARGQKLHEWGQTSYPVEYVYDDLGRATIQKTYRGATNLNATTWASVTKGTADLTKWVYDENTGLLKEKYDAANLDSTGSPITGAKKVAYTYTAAGQLATRTWARNVLTTYGYSSITGELLTVVYSDGTPGLTYTYNRLGQTSEVTDGTKVSTDKRTFTYALTGALELQSEDLPSTYFSGRRITYPRATSGVIGRPTGLQLGTSGTPTADQSITYSYDTYGRFNSVIAGGQTYAYGYTTNSNLIGTVSNSGLNYTDTRTYDPNHNWIDERKTTWGTTPDIKAKFAYNQDDMGRVTDVTKTYGLFSGYGAGSDKGLITAYTYNARSELLSENTTDRAGSPANITGRQTAYAYDEMGNRLTVTKDRPSGDAGGDLTFDYNSSGYLINNLNQYQRRTVPGIYDVAAVSTASSVTVDGGGMVKQGNYFFRGHPLDNSTAPIFDTLTIQPSGGSSQDHPAYLPMTNEDFKYDADGNLTRDGRWVYEYDAENRLVAMYTRGAPEDEFKTESPNVAVWNSGLPRQKLLFTYDYLGRRVEKKVYYWAGTSPGDWAVDDDFKFIYNGWNCIAKLDAGSGNAVVASYFWGLDLSGSQQGAGGVGGLLMTQEGDNTYLPAYDAMGNVHAMMTAANVTLGGTNYVAGDIVAAYEYDAFGNPLRESGPYAASNPFRFATKYTDIETGLIYHDTRYYSPSLGRFITRDSISEQGGLNLYAYVSNRVPNAWDYLGYITIAHYVGNSVSDENYLSPGHSGGWSVGNASSYMPSSLFTGPGLSVTQNMVINSISAQFDGAVTIEFGENFGHGAVYSGEAGITTQIGYVASFNSPSVTFHDDPYGSADSGGTSRVAAVNANVQPTAPAIVLPSPESLSGLFNSGPTATSGGWYGPTSTLLGGVDTANSAAEYLSFGATVGTNGSVYTSGWGGNQSVSTARISNIAGAAGNLLAVVSTGMDAVAWHNGTISGAEFTFNLSLTGLGYTGPQGAAVAGAYYLVDTFYPGGWLGDGSNQPYNGAGALRDYSTTIENNQKIVPDWQPRDLPY